MTPGLWVTVGIWMLTQTGLLIGLLIKQAEARAEMRTIIFGANGDHGLIGDRDSHEKRLRRLEFDVARMQGGAAAASGGKGGD